MTPPRGGITFRMGARTGSVTLKTKSLNLDIPVGTKLSRIRAKISTKYTFENIYRKFTISSFVILHQMLYFTLNRHITPLPHLYLAAIVPGNHKGGQTIDIVKTR